MKSKKHTALTVLALLILAAAPEAPAQNRPAPRSRTASHENLVRNFTSSLRSGNHGVVESALFNVLHIAASRPDADLSRLQREILRLETAGHTPSIRYKSLLARYVFKHPELLAEIQPERFESDSDYFQALTAHLGAKLLSDPAVAIR